VLLRWRGTALGWDPDCVNNPVVLAVATLTAGTYAIYADFSAMKWCVVPWLQKVKKLQVLLWQLPFRLFLGLQLFGTFLQILTIQNNAWFMVTIAQENDQVLDIWSIIWSHSFF